MCLASKDNLNAQCVKMSASGAEGKMERYPMALADEALDVAFQAGALKRCSKQPHVIVRMNDRSAKRKAYKLVARMIDACQSSFPNPSALMAAVKDVIEMGDSRCESCANPCGSGLSNFPNAPAQSNSLSK